MIERPAAVVLSLGSNIEPRLIRLRRAIVRIGGFVRIVRLSSVWETAPLDSQPGAPPFLNMVVVGTTRLRPEQLLTRCQEVEQEAGRRDAPRNAPRPLDVDIIWYDGVRGRVSRELELPHPRYRSRAFVLGPLHETRFERWDAGAPHRWISSLEGSGEAVPLTALW